MLAIHITDLHPNRLPRGFPPPGAPDTRPDDVQTITDQLICMEEQLMQQAKTSITLSSYINMYNDQTMYLNLRRYHVFIHNIVLVYWVGDGGEELKAHAYSNARSMVPMGLHYLSYGTAERHYMLQNTLPIHGMLQKNMSILFFSTENKP